MYNHMALSCMASPSHSELTGPPLRLRHGGVITSHCFIWMCWLIHALPLMSWWRHQMVKWEHFPRYWPFVRGNHRSPVISPHKGQWHRALMFSLICACINSWINNRDSGDWRRHRAHYGVNVMVGLADLSKENRPPWINDKINKILCTKTRLCSVAIMIVTLFPLVEYLAHSECV